MHQIDEFADERHQSSCIHCGGTLTSLETNRDHVPSRVLLREPLPTNLPVVATCQTCNLGFSRDEEYFVAFLGAVLSGTTEPDKQVLLAAARILTRSPALRASIERGKIEGTTISGSPLLEWRPDLKRIERVVVKNARGHAYFELGEPMLKTPGSAWSAPLATLEAGQRTNFDQGSSRVSVWPEIGSRMMTRLTTGQDLADGWIVVQPNIYQYCVTWDAGITVRSLIHGYLATEVTWAD
jgi:hypothetical protein